LDPFGDPNDSPEGDMPELEAAVDLYAAHIARNPGHLRPCAHFLV